MSLSAVLSKSISGLRVTQAGLDIVSQNVSNADAIGYIRRRVNIVEQGAEEATGFARVASVERMLDKVVQRQLWSESAGAGYTSARARYASALDQIYGAPNSSSSLTALFNRFTQSAQALKGDPASFGLRSSLLSAAGDLANRLNDLTDEVQGLRENAEAQINANVTRVNQLLQEIEAANGQIVNRPSDNGVASLRDARDRAVTELSRYMDVRTLEDPTGAMRIYTASGVTLFDGATASRLTFDARSGLGAGSLWNADPALRGTGTISVVDGTGTGYDLIANRSLRSGELAALVELRDVTLVQAQQQLDEFAANMASALSDREVQGTAVPGGLSVDTTGLLAGNQITLDYTLSSGFRGRFTFVRTDSAASAAAVNASGLSSGDNQVFGLDFSGASGTIDAQINARIAASGFTAAWTAPTLAITAAPGATVNALTARPSTTSALPSATGVPELPFFVDVGGTISNFTGSFESGVPQMRGFAGRIGVNPALTADRSRLVVFQNGPGGTTPQGDQTRVNQIYERLTSQTRAFSPLTGVGGSGVSWRSSVAGFAQRLTEAQGAMIESARRLDEGQQVALKAVEARFTEGSGVSVDQEMATLVELQNAYAANARVISAAREMMDLLMRL